MSFAAAMSPPLAAATTAASTASASVAASESNAAARRARSPFGLPGPGLVPAANLPRPPRFTVSETAETVGSTASSFGGIGRSFGWRRRQQPQSARDRFEEVGGDAAQVGGVGRGGAGGGGDAEQVTDDIQETGGAAGQVGGRGLRDARLWPVVGLGVMAPTCRHDMPSPGVVVTSG